jgi:hypothetical protein
MNVSRRLLVTTLAGLSLLATAAPAFADRGGAPNPNSCGVGQAETKDFQADTTLPGVSEIKLYPPVAFGCTGVQK